MTKLFGTVMACMMMLAVTSVYAQQPQGRMSMDPKERAKATTEQLKSALSLTTEQEGKVYELQAKQNEKMTAAFNSAGDDREKMREEMTKLQTETTAEMKKILTADQFKKYEETMANRMGQGRPAGR